MRPCRSSALARKAGHPALLGNGSLALARRPFICTKTRHGHLVRTHTTASPARTCDTLLRSKHRVIEEKRKQLPKIGPKGLLGALVVRLQCIPMWLELARLLWVEYQKSPSTFFDRDPHHLPPLKDPFPIQHEYLGVNGIRLHCVNPGERKPEKPLLLFVHGFPENWYSWRHQMVAFQDDWDVVVLEMRGFGASDKPQDVESYAMSTLVSDIAQSVKLLGHSKVTLVAHDWGGAIAWMLAGLMGPELLEGLVVLGLPHLGIAMTNGDADQRQRSAYMLAHQAPGGLAELHYTYENAAVMGPLFRGSATLFKTPKGQGPASGPISGVRNPEALTRKDINWYRHGMLRPGAATASLNYYRSYLEFLTTAAQPGAAAVWEAVRKPLSGFPVLVIHGDCDVALGPKLLQGIEAAVPRAEVHLLANCSHWAQQDYPEQVNEILRDFFLTHGLIRDDEDEIPFG